MALSGGASALELLMAPSRRGVRVRGGLAALAPSAYAGALGALPGAAAAGGFAGLDGGRTFRAHAAAGGRPEGFARWLVAAAAPRVRVRDAKETCNCAACRAAATRKQSGQASAHAAQLVPRRTAASDVDAYQVGSATNIKWHEGSVSREAREKLMGQKGCVLWFTGLSGSGKSTIANALQQKLFAMDKHTFVLDGDNVRHGLNRDLGFTDADRVENIRRVSNVAKLMSDAGLITLVSFISPFRSERRMARTMMTEGEFIEIHVDTPLEVAEQRDVKGLYKRARAGEIKNFTGLDSPYEAPEDPEIRINTVDKSPEEAADEIIAWMSERGWFEA